MLSVTQIVFTHINSKITDLCVTNYYALGWPTEKTLRVASINPMPKSKKNVNEILA